MKSKTINLTPEERRDVMDALADAIEDAEVMGWKEIARRLRELIRKVEKEPEMSDPTPEHQALYRRLDAGLPLSVGETKDIFQSLTGCVWSDDKRCEACNAEGRQMIGGVNRHEFACVACKGKGYVPRKAEPATMSVNPSPPFAAAVEENNRLRLEVGVLREKLRAKEAQS